MDKVFVHLHYPVDTLLPASVGAMSHNNLVVVVLSKEARKLRNDDPINIYTGIDEAKYLPAVERCCLTIDLVDG